jgi:hypothetical protein
MLRKIKVHNYLNGNIFSLIEFLFTALIVSPFTVYYVIHGRFVFAAVGIGIIFIFS